MDRENERTAMRLFEPGDRVGWDYLNRELLIRPTEVEPPPFPTVAPDIQMQLQRAQQAIVKYRSGTAAGAAGIGCLATLNPAVLIGYMVAKANATKRLRQAEEAFRNAELQLDPHRREVYAAWKAKEAELKRAERERVSTLPAWWGVIPQYGTKRIEIFGGNRFGWEGFVTVFGSSCIGSGRQLMVIDFSEDEVAGELARLACAADLPVDEQLLPANLDSCGLMAGLDGQQLAEVVLEGLHRDEVTADRSARSVDGHILETVSRALGPEVTAGKLAEAMLALMGEPASPRQLSPAEWDQVATELFSATYVQQSHDRFRQIHAYLSPLAVLGTRAHEPAGDARLISLAFQPGMSSARVEALTDLAMLWATRLLNARAVQPGTLLVIGADKAARAHLEKLSEACQRRGVRLVFLFRHLRETSLNLIGNGMVGIMQLGNHHEASEAADFIGREHSFRLSQLTKTTGGNRTQTYGESFSTGQSSSYSSSGSGGSSSTGSSYMTGTSASQAAGVNWSEAVGTQRTYEYRVEPSAIQGLPDYAMLLVQPGPSGPTFKIVDVNPDIATRPDATLQPMPEEYAKAVAVAEAAAERPGSDLSGCREVPMELRDGTENNDVPDQAASGEERSPEGQETGKDNADPLMRQVQQGIAYFGAVMSLAMPAAAEVSNVHQAELAVDQKQEQVMHRDQQQAEFRIGEEFPPGVEMRLDPPQPPEAAVLSPLDREEQLSPSPQAPEYVGGDLETEEIKTSEETSAEVDEIGQALRPSDYEDFNPLHPGS
jgi:hypothetical protein